MRNQWASLLLTAAGLGLLVFFGIKYVAQQQRNICGMVTLLDDRNQKLPPATDKDSADFRRELHNYRVKIGCT